MICRALIFCFLIVAVTAKTTKKTLNLSDIKKQATNPPTTASKATTTTAPKVTTTTAKDPCNLGCPNTWLPYASSCYKKFVEKANFATAEQRCQSFGGHLASFPSSTEQDSVKSLCLDAYDGKNLLPAKETPWIGLSYKAGGWSWVDGSSMAFSNFASGATNPPTKCGQLINTAASADRGKWTNQNCSTMAASFICKVAAS